MEIMSDFIFNSTFDQTEMDKEKGVVLEEMNSFPHQRQNLKQAMTYNYPHQTLNSEKQPQYLTAPKV